MALLKSLVLSSTIAELLGPVWRRLVFSEPCGDNDEKLWETRLALLLQSSAMSTWGPSQEGMVCVTDDLLHSAAVPRHNEMKKMLSS